jgi:tetratricopeptide (TPR) repeat protein
VAAARGKPGEAAELYAEAAEAMVALGDENGELACRSGACGCLAALSELDEARAGYQATLARAMELGRHAVASDCHAGLGEIAEEAGDPTGAAVRYREAAQAAAAAGDEMRRANSLGRLAGALVACRQYGEAADCAAAAAEVHEAMGIEDLTALDRWILADALLGLDRKREALAELVRAGDLFKRVGAVEDVAGISEQIDRVTEELRPEST